MQLERILQQEGLGSRKHCRALIQSGHVAVLGQSVTDPQADFVHDGLALTVDGDAFVARARRVLLLNKPAGYECSRQPQQHHSVFALLPARFLLRGVQPVGRLDQDTTGLLLLTDDGQLAHRLASPRHHVPKIYVATTRHPLDEAQLERLRAGLVLHDDPAPVAALACRAIDPHTLELTIAEGRYHQVKRMVAAMGNRCEALHRAAFGALVLGGLAEGEWRELDAAEIALLGAPGQ